MITRPHNTSYLAVIVALLLSSGALAAPSAQASKGTFALPDDVLPEFRHVTIVLTGEPEQAGSIVETVDGHEVFYKISTFEGEGNALKLATEEVSGVRFSFEGRRENESIEGVLTRARSNGLSLAGRVTFTYRSPQFDSLSRPTAVHETPPDSNE